MSAMFFNLFHYFKLWGSVLQVGLVLFLSLWLSLRLCKPLVDVLTEVFTVNEGAVRACSQKLAISFIQPYSSVR